MKRALAIFCTCVITVMFSGCEIKSNIGGTTPENHISENSQTSQMTDGSEIQKTEEHTTEGASESEIPSNTEKVCEHKYSEPTCTKSSECTLCGKVLWNTYLGHEYKEATCIEDAVCNRCGYVKLGSALGHEWKDATCTSPQTCALCGKTEGFELGHYSSKVRCLEERICDRCGESWGIAEHWFINGICISCGAFDTNVRWKVEGSTLIIYGNGPMQNYDGNGGPWEAKSIEKIIIEEGVTSIGDYAFSGHSNLVSIEIADSVTRIGQHAFNTCRSLTSIDIPEGVTYIGDLAFNYTGLTSVKIPDSVTSMGTAVFRFCMDLTSISAPKNLIKGDGKQDFAQCNSLLNIELSSQTTQIGDEAFMGCKSLTSVVIPNSVTSIGKWAFLDCDNLKHLEISNSVISIGDEAFWYCGNLESVLIPSSVVDIGESLFKNCRSTLVVYGETGSAIEAYCLENGYTFCTQPSEIEETSQK